MIAVVIGASGLVGKKLVSALAADSRVTEVVALLRKPCFSESKKIRQVIFSNISEISSLSKVAKGNLYFCCLGTTIKTAGSVEAFRQVDLVAVQAFAQICKTHGGQSFSLISAIGADTSSRLFYNRTKGEAESAVIGVAPRVVVWRPALLMGKRSEFRLGERIAIGIGYGIGPLLPERWRRSMMTDANRLALRMVEESLKSDMGNFVFSSSEI